MRLISTTKDAKHYHIVLIDEEAGTAVMAEAKKHVHAVTYIPARPQVDPQTGQPAVDPETGEPIIEQEGGWYIEPALDGHTHGLQEYELTNPVKDDRDDEEKASEVVALYAQACEISAKSRRNGWESEVFYDGTGQWESDVAAKLKAEDRACLTINLVAPNVDRLEGFQQQNRTDIKFIPVDEEGDQRVADILNVWAKNVLEQSYYEREESKVFHNEIVPGMGAFNIYVDTSEHIEGDARVESYPWDAVVFGPHDKEDLSDCEYLIKDKMMSLAKAKSLWPKKIEDIENNYRDVGGRNGVIHNSDNPYDDTKADAYEPVAMTGHPAVDIAKKEMRVLECWRKIYVPTAVLTNPAVNFYHNAYGWKQSDIKAAATLPGIQAVETTVTKIRITKLVGSTLVSDENPALLPVDDFFVVPVYCFKKGNKFWGKVEAVKDLQREVNRRHSQAIDIGNRMASYLWFYDDGTFPDGELSKFKQNASTPGAIIRVNNADKPPKKDEGIKFPAELVNLMNLGAQRIAELMDVRMPNDDKAQKSTDMMQQWKQLVGNNTAFDHLSFAKKKVGRLLVGICQMYYPPARILRILQQAGKKAATPLQIGGQELGEYTEDEIIALLENADLSRYDVVVAESNWSPSEQISTLVLLKEMASEGAPIPPEMMIKLTPIPTDEKQQIIQSIQQQAQANAEAESVKGDAEITKTLIAQGYLPPAVAQKYQIGPAQVVNNNQTDIPEAGGVAGQ